MNDIDLKQRIVQSILACSHGNFRDAGIRLLNSLGYASDRQVILEPNTFKGLVDIHPPLAEMNQKKALVDDWISVDLLFQLTGDDLKQMTQGRLIFDKNRMDNQIIESYLFLAIDLKPADYSRSKLADVTREVNKFFAMPVMILFKYGHSLTLSIINRRLNKHDESRDVLEKVTLIKDVSTLNPIRAHIEILFDLSLPQLEKEAQIQNFIALHNAWQKTLDTSALNKKFYRDIADWYFYAVEHVEFPADVIADRTTRNATNVIRLITRLIFVWFIKEKGLVPEELFDQRLLGEILKDQAPQKSAYYKAIIQNLFFATLNTEMGADRRFRGKNNIGGRDAHYGISTVYRYEDYFKNPTQALQLFSGIPFLNGGLFECLDKPDDAGKIIRVDGFSDDPRNQPFVPDDLFFGDELTVDMSEIYGDKHHNKEKIRGLIHVFNSYKFTIEENTPLDEEIALDPELLGKVFENLLAAYNPETGTTARKQTGSFYTPREIVNYMVDEALIAYLETALSPDLQAEDEKQALQTKLRQLLAYNDEPHQFSETEEQRLITAIDRVKVLDPACGSGAFPMGVLHKLVFILNKLDPGNVHWKERQIAKASEIPDATVRDQVIDDIEKSFNDNELDYGRKLYLIENCIYGVDIQPIAVQIAKLRFFISLVVDQTVNRAKPNLGIRPLPNLESKFVAANTLIGIEKPQQMLLHNPQIDEKEKQLAEVRDSLFTARTPATKRKYRELDKQLRTEITTLLKNDGWSNNSAEQLAGWDPYDQNTSAGFFDPGWMFGVMDGFDVIIGNPPYIQLSKVEGTPEWYKQYLKNHYNTSGGRLNTFIFFIHLALETLKYKGKLAYIIPNTILTQEYYAYTRELLLRENHLRIIVQYSELPFDSAIVENVTIILGKEIIKEYEIEILIDDLLERKSIGHKSNTTFLSNKNSSININQDEIVEKIFSTRYQKLDDFCEINQAIALKGDRSLSLYDSNSEGKYYKKLDGKNINRYSIKWDGKYLDYDLSKIHSCKRKDIFLSKEKLFFRRVSENLMFAYDNEQYFALNTLVVVNLKKTTLISIKYFLGILNSRLMNYIYKRNFKSTKTVFSEIQANTVGQLPIIIGNSLIQKDIETLVNRIIIFKQGDPYENTDNFEAEIDQLVYKLYGLTEEDIAFIEDDAKQKIL
jgi:adenine-specific DNA-methyltransferase